MRLIDAEPIIKNLSAMKKQLGYDAIDIDGMIKALREVEVVTDDYPPNDQLTLEELREMDGEPVWWWNTSSKPVCTICTVDRFGIESAFVNFDFIEEDSTHITKYDWLRKRGYKAYRRKPEEGTV